MTTESRTRNSCIVVFDVGKTNKKLLVFDHDLRQIHSVYQTFEEKQQEGISSEMVEEASAWLMENLKLIASRHDIGAVSIAAHGASFACLDGGGNLTMPVMAYTTDPGEAFHEEFYRLFGSADELHVSTATPNMPGLACMAKGIYYARKRFPAAFSATTAILNLPQYYGFLLTGRKGVENTYLGSHTYLWDFKNQQYGPLVDKMGIRGLLPSKVQRPWDVLGTISPEISRKTGLPESTVVTLGIHDSNASLLPYLVKADKPFILNSTGTVCVAMRPGKSADISPTEMGKVVFYNQSAFSDPVRTTIFLGGLEFDVYTGQLLSRHGARPFPSFNAPLCESILRDRHEFLLPSIVPFGIFPGSRARVIEQGSTFAFGDIMGGKTPALFDDFERSYAVINLSLAIQSRVAMEKAGMQKGDLLYVEGGFHKNDVYTTLLASMFPESRVMLSGMEEATAFGAALLAKSALEEKNPRELGSQFEIGLRAIQGHSLKGLDEYMGAFLEHVRT